MRVAMGWLPRNASCRATLLPVPLGSESHTAEGQGTRVSRTVWWQLRSVFKSVELPSDRAGNKCA